MLALGYGGIKRIDLATRITLQEIGKGGELGETLSHCIWALCQISVEINDPELDRGQKDAATSELYQDVIWDRLRNGGEVDKLKSGFDYAKPDEVPSVL